MKPTAKGESLIGLNSCYKATMLPYTGNPLNRRCEKRADADFVATAFRDPASLFLPFFNGAPLCGEGPRLMPLTADQSAPSEREPWVFLGYREDVAIFTFDIGKDSDRATWLGGFGRFEDLRTAAPNLPLEDLAIASHAKGMLEWLTRSRFCGRCGAATDAADGGNKRVCPRCGAEEFPRLDPAVIMLATCGDRCLLARNVKWNDLFSTLAGFVEPGESLEEAVAREMFEEVGVKATKVRYAASQPWPFPAALMLGFFAEVEGTNLHPDPTEIAEAHWFSREEARALLAGEMPGRRGPSKAAIAHCLIETWAKAEDKPA